MSKNYISVDRSDYLLKQIISYKKYDEIGEKLKDAIYANLKEIEKVGFDEIFKSLGSAEKLLDDLKDYDFIYKSKKSNMVLSLMNKIMMTDQEIIKIKNTFEQLFDEYKNVVKRKKAITRDLSFEVYGEYRDMKFKEIEWDNVKFYIPNDNKIRDLGISVSLIKEIGFALECSQLRDMQIEMLEQDPSVKTVNKKKLK